jgi:hypothetical protein
LEKKERFSPRRKVRKANKEVAPCGASHLCGFVGDFLFSSQVPGPSTKNEFGASRIGDERLSWKR